MRKLFKTLLPENALAIDLASLFLVESFKAFEKEKNMDDLIDKITEAIKGYYRQIGIDPSLLLDSDYREAVAMMLEEINAKGKATAESVRDDLSTVLDSHLARKERIEVACEAIAGLFSDEEQRHTINEQTFFQRTEGWVLHVVEELEEELREIGAIEEE